MLSYNPQSLGDKDVEFYTALLAGANFPSGVVALQPFPVMGSFLAASGSSVEYYPELNRSAGIGTLQGKALFHGNLFLNMYCSAFVAGGDVTVNLYLYNGVTVKSWPVETRTIAAVDQPGLTRMAMLPGVFFNYIGIVNNSGGANFTYNVAVNFVGVKIN